MLKADCQIYPKLKCSCGNTAHILVGSVPKCVSCSNTIKKTKGELHWKMLPTKTRLVEEEHGIL